MEPLDVVRWLVTTQVLLVVALLLARVIPADPRGAVRHGRVLLVTAFVAPLVTPLLPFSAPVRPAAQVFARSGFLEAPTLAVAIGSEPKPAIAVEDAHVAGAIPALARDRARGEGRVGVAREEVGAARPDLAGLAGGKVAALVVDDADLHARERVAVGAVALRLRLVGRRTRDGRVLRRAVGAGDLDPQPLGPLQQHLHG